MRLVSVVGGQPLDLVVRDAEGLIHQAAQVSVPQPVHHAPALLARGDKSGEPEPAQVLADGWSGGAARGRERGHVRLALAKATQQREPGPVGQQAEHLDRDRKAFAVVWLLRPMRR